jgi:hypothetical protein
LLDVSRHSAYKNTHFKNPWYLHATCVCSTMLFVSKGLRQGKIQIFMHLIAHTHLGISRDVYDDGEYINVVI